MVTAIAPLRVTHLLPQVAVILRVGHGRAASRLPLSRSPPGQTRQALPEILPRNGRWQTLLPPPLPKSGRQTGDATPAFLWRQVVAGNLLILVGIVDPRIVGARPLARSARLVLFAQFLVHHGVRSSSLSVLVGGSLPP